MLIQYESSEERPPRGGDLEGYSRSCGVRITSGFSDMECNDGFDASSDLFGLKGLADRLGDMLASLEHGTVCLLDGRWGVGKTTFVKQWIVELRKRRIPAIYFDAFSSDYIESPFEAIAGTFVEAATEARRTAEPAYRQFLSSAAKVGKSMAAAGAKLGVKVATLGVISNSDLEEIRTSISDSASEITEEQVKRLLESHADRKTAFASLKKSLLDLPALLAAEFQGSEDYNGPLIVVVDELDRCRPDFALGIVETLKHFFRSDKIHFVLVTNRTQLERAVAAKYGTGESSSEYLEKFYDFSVAFELNYSRRTSAGIQSFISRQANSLLPKGQQDVADVLEYLLEISKAFKLSLRDISSLTTNVAISYLAYNDRELRPAVLITFLSLFKTKHPALYRKARIRDLSSRDVQLVLESVKWDRLDINRINNIFDYYLSEIIDEQDQKWRGYGEDIWRFNINREDVIPFIIENVLERFGAPATAQP